MKAVYRGPADSVEVDGISVKRGEATDLTSEQIARIRADPGANVEVTGDGETPDAREKTVAAQAKQRERQAAEATKAAAKPAGKD
jgi:hypothetical protein